MKRTNRSFRFVIIVLLVLSLTFPMTVNAYAVTDGSDEITSTSNNGLDPILGGQTNLQSTGPAIQTTSPAVETTLPAVTTNDVELESPEISNSFDSLPDSIKNAIGEMGSLRSLTVSKYPELRIDSVEVANGGAEQARNRDYVTKDEAYGVYVTSKRNASMTDARIFNVFAIFTPDQLGMEDLREFDISCVDWTYGGKSLSEWKQYGKQSFNGDPAITVLNQAHYTDGEILVVVGRIKFDEFYPDDLYSVNIPYEGYTAVKKEGFPLFSPDDQKILGPHALDMIYLTNSNTRTDTITDTAPEIIASTSIELNLYDSFHTWQEIGNYATDLQTRIEANSEINERYVTVSAIAKSQAGREIWNVVIAEDADSVDQYLNDTKPLMETAEGIEDLLSLLDDDDLNDDQLNVKGSEIEYPKIPIYFNNVHPDETPASDAIMELINTFIYDNKLSYETQVDAVHHERTPGDYDGYTSQGDANETDTVSFTVNDILDHFILVFNITENPDGKDNLVRTNEYGFDLNRDAAYQTQKESTALTTDLVKWDPIAMLEYHGYVDELLIEPCTGPHDPNYEYDLYADKMLAQGNALGKAMIGNTAYSQYLVPATDYSDSWDDGAPVYGPMFAMLFGTMGYTLEIPYSTEDSKEACYTAGLALAYDCLDNFESYYENKLNYKLRGIHNEDNPEVDKLLTDPYTGEQVGRPRAEGRNFFPEYYVIPVDSNCQKNPLEAYKALEFLMRNGAKLSITNEDVSYGDVNLPVGTFVIDMNQANRGFVNSMLSDGYDASRFADIYAEIVISYPDMRNFKCITVWEDELFAKNTDPVVKIKFPGTFIEGMSGKSATTLETSDQVVIYNNNIDVIKLVNRLLDHDRPVQILTRDSEPYKKGDFVISSNDLYDYCGDLLVYGALFTGSLDYAKNLVEPEIAVLGSSSHSRFVLEMLGFTYKDDFDYPADISKVFPENTDVLIGFNNSSDVTSLVSGGGIGFIGIGTSTMNAAKTNNLLPGLDCYIPKSRTTETYREGLVVSSYSKNNLVTANYDQTDAAYVMNGTYITKAPYDGEALITVDSGADFFKAGWYPDHDVLKGEMLAVSGFSGSNHDTPVTLFANNIFSKAHAQHTYNMFANAVFLSALDYGTAKPLIEASPDSQATLTPSVNIDLEFTADREVRKADSVNKVELSKYKITTSEAEDPYDETSGGWIDYTTTSSITLTSTGAFYLHAYAENTLGENVQRVFGPYNIGTTGGGSGSGGHGGGDSSSTPAVTPPAVTVPAISFTDINGHWAKTSIEYVVGKKLFSGVNDTLFAPDATMTRGMLVTVLGRAYGLNTASYSAISVFTDVPQSGYYAPYVAWAYENKIVSGKGDGIFAPDTPVTRGEMATIITNYMKYIGKGTKSTAALNYADAAEIDSWGLEGVQFVTANGLMTGIDGNNFGFDGLSSRAQVATVMERLMKLIGQ